MTKLPNSGILFIANITFLVDFESQGLVLQRFPTKEWKNYPYEFHVESVRALNFLLNYAHSYYYILI